MNPVLSQRRRAASRFIRVAIFAALAAIICRETAGARAAECGDPALRRAGGESAPAAGALPAHITLPIVLAHTIDSRHAAVGQSIAGKLVQHVQTGEHAWLRKGAIVHGRILAVNAAHSADGPSVTLEFDSVASKSSVWKTKTCLRALASLMEVFNATEPAENFDDRGNNNEQAWTMRQIGGDIVYHDSGLIENRHGRKVGTEDAEGQYSLPAAHADGTQQLPRALGLFSTSAEGVYGMPGYSIANHKTGDAITISAGPDAKYLRLHYGIAMLLETQP